MILIKILRQEIISTCWNLDLRGIGRNTNVYDDSRDRVAQRYAISNREYSVEFGLIKRTYISQAILIRNNKSHHVHVITQYEDIMRLIRKLFLYSGSPPQSTTQLLDQAIKEKIEQDYQELRLGLIELIHKIPVTKE